MLKKDLINISIAIAGLIVAAISLIWILNNNFSLDSAGAIFGIGLGLTVVGVTKFFTKTDSCETFESENLLPKYKAQFKANNITKWLILGSALLSSLSGLPIWFTLLLLVIHLFSTLIQTYLVNKYTTQ